MSREVELIYKIVEQWGNALCTMEEKEQWLKEYAAQETASLKAEVDFRDRHVEALEQQKTGKHTKKVPIQGSKELKNFFNTDTGNAG